MKWLLRLFLIPLILFAEEKEIFTPRHTLEFVSTSELNRRFIDHFDVKLDQQNLIGYIGIAKEEIDSATYVRVKRSLEHFKKVGAIFVILDIDSEEGDPFAALLIADQLIKSDFNDRLPIVGLINEMAVGMSAALPYSCRFVGAFPQSSMGGVDAGSHQKALDDEFGHLAAAFGRNPDLAMAMVDPSIVLVIRQNEVIALRQKREILPSDVVITPGGSPLVVEGVGLRELGIADLFLTQNATNTPTVEEVELGRWPFSKSPLAQNQLLSEIPNAEIITYSSWTIPFWAFITNPIVSALLFLMFIVGFYIELIRPSFSFYGAFATVSLILIVLGHLAIYDLGWIELIFVIVGALLLMWELLLIPCFGVAGVFGLLFMTVGIIGLFIPGYITGTSLGFTFNILLKRLALLAAAVILAALVIAYLAKKIPKKVLPCDVSPLGGDEAGETIEETLPKAGTTGLAFTALRPSGKVEINFQVYDAVTEGSFIEKHQPIIVDRIEGDNLVVRSKD